MACEITCARRSHASARGLQLELTSEHAFDCSFPSTSSLKEQHQAEEGGSKIPPALLSHGGDIPRTVCKRTVCWMGPSPPTGSRASTSSGDS